MGALSPTMLIAKGVDLRRLVDIVNADPRWELARKLGMTDMQLRLDPQKPDRGQIQTQWDKAESALTFLAEVEKPFTFTADGKTIARPNSEPRVMVNPKRNDELAKKLSNA